MAKTIVVNDIYIGDFYSVITLEPTIITLLMAGAVNVTNQFITDPTGTIPALASICNDTSGGNYFTEIQVNGTVNLVIK